MRSETQELEKEYKKLEIQFKELINQSKNLKKEALEIHEDISKIMNKKFRNHGPLKEKIGTLFKDLKEFVDSTYQLENDFNKLEQFKISDATVSMHDRCIEQLYQIINEIWECLYKLDKILNKRFWNLDTIREKSFTDFARRTVYMFKQMTNKAYFAVFINLMIFCYIVYYFLNVSDVFSELGGFYSIVPYALPFGYFLLLLSFIGAEDFIDGVRHEDDFINKKSEIGTDIKMLNPNIEKSEWVEQYKISVKSEQYYETIMWDIGKVLLIGSAASLSVAITVYSSKSNTNMEQSMWLGAVILSLVLYTIFLMVSRRYRASIRKYRNISQIIEKKLKWVPTMYVYDFEEKAFGNPTKIWTIFVGLYGLVINVSLLFILLHFNG